MKNKRLKDALKSCRDNSCTIYREHYWSGKTHIQIFNPFWELMLDGWFITGATDQQCEAIETTIKQWIGEVK